jgi:glycine/D-amino acid oxidase-like deaminating enzyme
MKIEYTDVLVIGGGLAGLRVAIGAKRRGHDAVILSLVPPKRSHSAAAQGGMQASLANVIKGQGDNEDEPFRGHRARQRLGRRPARRPDVRRYRAEGGARARGLGRAVEPGRARRPPGRHQRARRSR